MLRHCKTHGKVEHFQRSQSSGSFRCRKCASDAVKRRRRKVKEILVEEHGGKCTKCGYNKSIKALQFHHVDPATKSFGIAAAGHSRSLDKMREEAQKCILICANCHAEEH